MDDFFKKEITPFARVSVGNGQNRENGILWFERWKFIDNGVYNRAVKVSWDMSSNLPVNNWTDLQRRIKHLIVTRIELDTMLDWIAEEVHQGYLNLIKLPDESITEPMNAEFDFWNWDQLIFQFGARACLFQNDKIWKDKLDNLMVLAIQTTLNTGSDKELIQIKKQFSEIMREIYDLVICTCPWDGVINGGPMLPNQEINTVLTENETKINCHYEFSVLGGRARDLKWIKDLKFPELSHTAQIWIQHGASRNDLS